MLSSAHVRQWLSPLVTVLFAAIALTGVLMLLELRLAGIREFHEIAGIGFAAVGLAHLASNWKTLVAHFRKPVGWFTLVAGLLVCAALLVAGAAGGEDHEDGVTRGDRHQQERRS